MAVDSDALRFFFVLISYSGYLYTRQSISEKDPRELIPLVMFIDLTRESLAPSLVALGLSMRDSLNFPVMAPDFYLNDSFKGKFLIRAAFEFR